MFGSMRRVEDEVALTRQRTVRFHDERAKPTIPIHQKQVELAASRLGLGSSGKNKLFVAGHDLGFSKIIDPSSDFILRWTYIFRITCFIALFVDPLYFYVPKIVYGPKTPCVGKDRRLAIIVTVFRTIADIFYAMQIVIKFKTAYINPSSTLGVFGRGDLVTDSKDIAKQYLRSDFAIDLVASLPLPQEHCGICSPLTAKPHVGKDIAGRKLMKLVANPELPEEVLLLPLVGLAESKIKFDNICYGQTLSVSTYMGETLYAIFLAMLGLVLFAHLIGKVQTYLQSITARVEEWRLKQRDTEEWMRHRQLPHELRERVRRFIHYKWLATRGVDEESILKALPADLRRDIKRHLCLDLVCRVPFFSQMDDQLLDAICERLISSLCTDGTYIVREGDPVAEMLFIIRGKLESSTTDGGRTGFFNSITLKPGDFCGEELLEWALVPKPTVNLPSSTRTVRALVEVEAFALRAEDLRFVASQFRRLHSRKLQHTFRYHSHHWKTWATRFIQHAWRRYKRRKMANDLSMRESFSSVRSFNDGASPEQNLAIRRGTHIIKELPKLRKPSEPDFSAEHGY
ncbi:hypothetical protein EJB05_45893 [Eragrostis curvula]|uniref:Cyclic nucleotide-binding domain-containing protein n=1 Tax=Eragrostis curvula TaxID=38414 RepID=A0A5J9TMZ1_9POAL|nr:hypothetical protein EJB05_45893 [Eragrostis curvula]